MTNRRGMSANCNYYQGLLSSLKSRHPELVSGSSFTVMNEVLAQVQIYQAFGSVKVDRLILLI